MEKGGWREQEEEEERKVQIEEHTGSVDNGARLAQAAKDNISNIYNRSQVALTNGRNVSSSGRYRRSHFSACSFTTPPLKHIVMPALLVLFDSDRGDASVWSEVAFRTVGRRLLSSAEIKCEGKKRRREERRCFTLFIFSLGGWDG